jgi:hypothetical protein
MYKLYMDDKFIEIADFTESLDSVGNLTFNVSSHQLDLTKSSFTGLKNLRDAIAQDGVMLKVTDENDNVFWEDADYSLQNASFSASPNGVYFSAYFTQFAPTEVPSAMSIEPVDNSEEFGEVVE